MKDNLGQKLERMSLPEIEIKEHRRALRRALLSSEHFKKRSFCLWLKDLTPSFASVGAFLLLGLVFGSNFVYGKIIQARAMDITRNSPGVQKLNIDFRTAQVSFRRLPDQTPVDVGPAAAVGGEDKDQRALVEIRNDRAIYSVMVNLTHREVENVQEEAREQVRKTEEEAKEVKPAGQKEGGARRVPAEPIKEKPKDNLVNSAKEESRDQQGSLLDRLHEVVATTTNYWRQSSKKIEIGSEKEEVNLNSSGEGEARDLISPPDGVRGEAIETPEGQKTDEKAYQDSRQDGDSDGSSGSRKPAERKRD